MRYPPTKYKVTVTVHSTSESPKVFHVSIIVPLRFRLRVFCNFFKKESFLFLYKFHNFISFIALMVSPKQPLYSCSAILDAFIFCFLFRERYFTVKYFKGIAITTGNNNFALIRHKPVRPLMIRKT